MYARRFLHHGDDPTTGGTLIDDRAVAGAWFELHRHGGCGAGELVLRDRFPDAIAASSSGGDDIDVGDWISFEFAAGERWYLGRIEERHAASPAEVAFRLEGPAIQLNEVFPGGFAGDVEAPPHRVGFTDLFSNDPDRSAETWDTATFPDDVVTWLLTTYVTPATDIIHDSTLIEEPPNPEHVLSHKFRGEESARSLLKTLALLADAASWGVRQDLKAFFLKRRGNIRATFQEGFDVTSLSQSRDREFLFNRLLLTGDYIYPASGGLGGRPWRFRANYWVPSSVSAHGERRIRLWVPWIRADDDALAFARAFFAVYSEPTTRYLIETDGQKVLPLPWTGRVRLLDRNGTELAAEQLSTLRVQFDHVPRFRMELGPEDPRTLFPEPPQDERWELPGGNLPGGSVSVTSDDPPPTLSSEDSSGSDASTGSTGSTGSSGASSGDDSGLSSGTSDSEGSSDASSGDEPTSGLIWPPIGSGGGGGGEESSAAGSSAPSSELTNFCVYKCEQAIWNFVCCDGVCEDPGEPPHVCEFPGENDEKYAVWNCDDQTWTIQDTNPCPPL